MQHLTEADLTYLAQQLPRLTQALGNDQPSAAFQILNQLSSPAAAEEFLDLMDTARHEQGHQVDDLGTEPHPDYLAWLADGADGIDYADTTITSE